MARERNGEAVRLLDAVRALVRRFAVGERADVSCAGMTIAQAATLEILAAEGALRLGALGQRLGITPSTLTRNLARLEERGLVERTVDDVDARAFRASLTPAGRRAAAAVRAAEVRFAGQILDRLPRHEASAVVEHLEHLLVAVRDATEGCCPGAFEHLMTDFPRAARAKGARKEKR